MFESFIARRYIKSDKTNRFFSFITFITIAGMAIGVASLITVLSVIDGFESGLRDRFLAANAHILLYKFPSGLKDHEEAARIIGKKIQDDATGISPFIFYESVISHNYINHPVLVRGIAPKQRESVQSLKSIVSPPEALDILEQDMQNSTSPYPVILGSAVLELIKAKVGDEIQIITPIPSDDESFSRERNRLKIVGIYASGLNHYDRKLAIVSLKAAQALFGMHDLVTGLEIGLKNPDDSKRIANQLSEAYPSMSINEWQSFNQSMFQIVQKQRSMIGMLVFLVSMVASFNILSTMFIAVTQKQRDISLLRSLGARKWQVMLIFLQQSVFMAAIGTILGCLLAALINYVLGNHEIIKLPDAYFLTKLPVKNDITIYIGMSSVALLLSMLAALGPSWVASRITPTTGLSQKLD